MRIRDCRTLWRSERGIALPTAMIALMLLTTLLVAFAVLSKSEPTIASNQARASQARALAETGVEQAVYALNSTLDVTTALYNGFCSGSVCSPSSSFVALGTIGGYFVSVQAGTASNEQIVDAWGWAPAYASTGITASGVAVSHKHIHLTLNKMTFVNFVPPAGLNVRGELEVGPSNAASVDGSTDTSCGNKAGTYSSGAATIDHPGNVTGYPATVQNVPTSTFDQYIFTNSDLDMLKALGQGPGTVPPGQPELQLEQPAPDQRAHLHRDAQRQQPQLHRHDPRHVHQSHERQHHRRAERLGRLQRVAHRERQHHVERHRAADLQHAPPRLVPQGGHLPGGLGLNEDPRERSPRRRTPRGLPAPALHAVAVGHRPVSRGRSDRRDRPRRRPGGGRSAGDYPHKADAERSSAYSREHPWGEDTGTARVSGVLSWDGDEPVAPSYRRALVLRGVQGTARADTTACGRTSRGTSRSTRSRGASTSSAISWAGRCTGGCESTSPRARTSRSTCRRPTP